MLSLSYLFDDDKGDGVLDAFWSKFRCLRVFCPSLTQVKSIYIFIYKQKKKKKKS